MHLLIPIILLQRYAYACIMIKAGSFDDANDDEVYPSILIVCGYARADRYREILEKRQYEILAFSNSRGGGDNSLNKMTTHGGYVYARLKNQMDMEMQTAASRPVKNPLATPIRRATVTIQTISPIPMQKISQEMELTKIAMVPTSIRSFALSHWEMQAKEMIRNMPLGMQ